MHRLTSTKPWSSHPTPAHDARGNLTHDPYAPNTNGVAAGQKYMYDAENRLVEVTTDDAPPLTLFEISYDALGRRIASVDHTGASDPCGGGSPCSCVSGSDHGYSYPGAAGGTLTRHIFAGIQTIQERIWCSVSPADWDQIREFVWGPGFPEPVALVDYSELGDSSAGVAEVLP